MSDRSQVRIGVLTLSDKGAAGERVDASGRLVAEMAALLGTIACRRVVADERDQISDILVEWVDREGLDLILTTGGTGLSPRDVTPQATSAIIDYQVPGLVEAMRLTGLQKTPHAMLSRGVAGVRGRCLIINLPGSPKAVQENLEVVLPALPHALAKLAGDPADCAQS